MTRFNPFGEKSISELKVDDLAVLFDTKEGWYIEYKRELPNPKAIAKSVSAFANTYGGWLFFGVSENKDRSICFLGVPSGSLVGSVQTIRQAVASHLNPTPFFEILEFHGPCEKIGLADGMSVICVSVPSGVCAPFVHSTGLIYRRVGDGSEPVVEQDRHQLELMFTRRSKSDEDYNRWIRKAPEVPVEAQGCPYLRIMLDADPHGQKGLSWGLTSKKLKTLLGRPEETYVVPFEAVHAAGTAIVARQTSSLPKYNGFALTFILLEGAKCEIHIPLNVFEVVNLENLNSSFSHYEHIAEFCRMLSLERFNSWKIVDLTHAFVVLLAIARKFFSLLSSINPEATEVWVKVIASGVHYAVPFLDTRDFVRSIKEGGIPLCILSQVMVPTGEDSSGFAHIPANLRDQSSGAIFAAWLFEMICMALSVEGLYSERSEEERLEMLNELLSASQKVKR